MAISEAARHDLYTGLRDVIGPERAETLMSAIPLHDLDEVVTKADLRAEAAGLCAEIADLRTEVRTGLANLVANLEAQNAAMYKHVNRLVGAVLVSIVGAVLGVGILT
ncbi:MAG: hypothetical protein ACLFWH_15615 [Actinomycetota bacterium]